MCGSQWVGTGWSGEVGGGTCGPERAWGTGQGRGWVSRERGGAGVSIPGDVLLVVRAAGFLLRQSYATGRCGDLHRLHLQCTGGWRGEDDASRLVG